MGAEFHFIRWEESHGWRVARAAWQCGCALRHWTIHLNMVKLAHLCYVYLPQLKQFTFLECKNRCWMYFEDGASPAEKQHAPDLDGVERGLGAGCTPLSLSSLESRALWKEWLWMESKKLGFISVKFQLISLAFLLWGGEGDILTSFLGILCFLSYPSQWPAGSHIVSASHCKYIQSILFIHTTYSINPSTSTLTELPLNRRS